MTQTTPTTISQAILARSQEPPIKRIKKAGHFLEQIQTLAPDKIQNLVGAFKATMKRIDTRQHPLGTL